MYNNILDPTIVVDMITHLVAFKVSFECQLAITAKISDAIILWIEKCRIKVPAQQYFWFSIKW